MIDVTKKRILGIIIYASVMAKHKKIIKISAMMRYEDFNKTNNGLLTFELTIVLRKKT